MLATDAAARLALPSTVPIWKEEICKEKKNSLLYILDSSLPRKQPWPGMTGQPPPSLEETDNKKGELRGNESAILHAVNGPSIKICLAAECEGLLYFGHQQPPNVWY